MLVAYLTVHVSKDALTVPPLVMQLYFYKCPPDALTGEGLVWDKVKLVYGGVPVTSSLLADLLAGTGKINNKYKKIAELLKKADHYYVSVITGSDNIVIEGTTLEVIANSNKVVFKTLDTELVVRVDLKIERKKSLSK